MVDDPTWWSHDLLDCPPGEGREPGPTVGMVNPREPFRAGGSRWAYPHLPSR